MESPFIYSSCLYYNPKHRMSNTKHRNNILLRCLLLRSLNIPPPHLPLLPPDVLLMGYPNPDPFAPPSPPAKPLHRIIRLHERPLSTYHHTKTLPVPSPASPQSRPARLITVTDAPFLPPKSLLA